MEEKVSSVPLDVLQAGILAGEKRVNMLNAALIATGRWMDVVRSAHDSKYQEQLFQELQQEMVEIEFRNRGHKRIRLPSDPAPDLKNVEVERFNMLMIALLATGRLKEIFQAIADEEYEEKLFEEFNINWEDCI